MIARDDVTVPGLTRPHCDVIISTDSPVSGHHQTMSEISIFQRVRG